MAGSCRRQATRSIPRAAFQPAGPALQAAIDGAGVVLGWRTLASDDISAGRLTVPFDLELPLGSAFFFVYPEAYSMRAKVIAFRDWLRSEAAY